MSDLLTTTALHPLRPLDSSEIEHFRRIVVDAGHLRDSTRFSSVLLREPDKADVLAFPTATPLPREVTALLTDLAHNTLTEVIVDLTAEAVTSAVVHDPREVGWGPTLDEDFPAADEIVKTDFAWVAALARRGVTDLDKVRTVPLTAGTFGYEDERGIRMCRVLAFYEQYPGDSVWAHPIDGVVAHVDLSNGRVLRVVETDVVHVPEESGDYTDPAVAGTPRGGLKPIHITQPEGVSFELDGEVLRWQNWEVRVGFNGREGLTLHQLSFQDGDRKRPIMYRGSISEMVVPYGDPSPTHAWQNYFDVGEYQFGRLANSLELGCDCLGEITYLDATVVDDHGNPKLIPNAICIHEEDYGVLWKHSDDFSEKKVTRRQRRLVVSFFVTVGNYDYGFYWYLYLDGTVELEGKATGIVFTSGYPGKNDDGSDYVYASEVAPGLGAPYHQHLFSARLDMTVDGIANSVDELDLQRVPMGPDNPWGNAITRRIVPLTTEGEAQRCADSAVGRVWSIRSDETVNRLGHAPSYVLYPEGQPVLAAADGSPARNRAAFATKHLWVTRYDRDQLWAAGTMVNQSTGGAGLPAYAAENRSIVGEDLVVWHTFGLTHFPRTEDWPIMPTDYAGFTLKPHGFFDRNPTLDVPENAEGDRCTTHAPRSAHGFGHAGEAGAHADDAHTGHEHHHH
ncbi:primary-amine oxidase [Promicromonospora soli]